ncbi:MAG: hypothetical protein ABI807_01665 [Sporichthyaceae bacterium]
MRTKSRVIISIAAVAVSAASLTACGGGSDESSVKPVADVPNLSGKSTAVALDSGFVDALTTLKLTPGTLGGATLDGGSLSFPITGGEVAYYKPGTRHPYVTGHIQHDNSGLSLSSGGTEVDLTDFNINPANSRLYGNVSVNGKSAAKHAMIFKLNGTTLKPLQTGPNNTAILEGTTVHISKTAADLLNQTFKTDAVAPGLLVGVAKITINTK